MLEGPAHGATSGGPEQQEALEEQLLWSKVLGLCGLLLLLLTGLLQVCGGAALPAGPGAGVGRRGAGSEQRNKCATSFSLQEDFVRWKGCLFFRFIITVVDPNPEVAR